MGPWEFQIQPGGEKGLRTIRPARNEEEVRVLDQLCCRLTFEPEFARRNARLVSAVEEHLEMVILFYWNEAFPHEEKYQLDGYSTGFDLEELYQEDRMVFLRIDIELPNGSERFINTEKLLKKLRARVRMKFDDLTGHFTIQVAPAAVAA